MSWIEALARNRRRGSFPRCLLLMEGDRPAVAERLTGLVAWMASTSATKTTGCRRAAATGSGRRLGRITDCGSPAWQFQSSHSRATRNRHLMVVGASSPRQHTQLGHRLHGDD